MDEHKAEELARIVDNALEDLKNPLQPLVGGSTSGKRIKWIVDYIRDCAGLSEESFKLEHQAFCLRLISHQLDKIADESAEE